jgi:hypothetical protein
LFDEGGEVLLRQRIVKRLVPGVQPHLSERRASDHKHQSAAEQDETHAFRGSPQRMDNHGQLS